MTAPTGSHSEPLFHLALADEWTDAQARGTYDRSTIGVSLAEEGFIHLSFAHQVRGVAERFYAGAEHTVLLRIAPARLGDDADLRVEDLYDIGEAFPHLYGPLPVGAIVAASPVTLGDDGVPDVSVALGRQ